ncbi:Serine/threonine-protein kinase rio1 [Extremus antarcticus]|uniref:Serine/threonine-protein kinase RIO1 n=1 Tax=Extremus antarcticus TaxID=702011 RepID=A0AAJ0DBD1_9PEZI|nr:Serine/threonine-protein kinase rio1 [Extremus antarcticus]
MDQPSFTAHEPPHTFNQHTGYTQPPSTISATGLPAEVDPIDHLKYDQPDPADEYIDDLFEPSEDDLSDSELQASNPSDYTKSYNRQRRANDNSIPDTEKRGRNPQLNTRAEVDDHIKTLSRHAAKLRLNDQQAGLAGQKGGHGAEKSDRATSEQVLDPRTRMILLQLLNRDVVSEIHGVISTGKEANVYHALSNPAAPEEGEVEKEAAAQPIHRAIKVYKTSILVFKDRDKYVQGEYRFRQGYNKSNNRAMVKVWAEKEYRNLRRLHAAGIPCPEAVYLKAHVLVMSFIGDRKGWPAPRLRDFEFTAIDGQPASDDEMASKWRSLYVELLGYMRRMYQICRLVHADLSEYNILYHTAQQRLYIIDVSQSVEHDHPRSLEFLRMDVRNVTDFFSRKGVDTLSERAVFGFVVDGKGSTEMEGMKASLEKLYERREQGEEDEVDNEVFRQEYIPQNLQQVYDIERDGEKVHEGREEELVYSALLAKGQTADAEHAAKDAEKNAEQGGEDAGGDASGEGDSDDEDGSGFESDENKQPRGKRFEDKDEKRAHKQLVKEEKREKRTQKMPKHVKKKLVDKGSRGKK